MIPTAGLTTALHHVLKVLQLFYLQVLQTSHAHIAAAPRLLQDVKVTQLHHL